MKTILFTLLTVACAHSLITQDTQASVKPPLSNILKYNAKLIKEAAWGEKRMFTFEAIIRLNKTAGTAHISVCSYEDENPYEASSDFTYDMHPEMVWNLAAWLTKEVPEIKTFTFVITNPDGVKEQKEYVVNKSLYFNGWKAMYIVQPYTLIG